MSKTVECEYCDGTGATITTHSVFSMSAEQWYPREEEVECEECHGAGFIAVDDDEEDDDDETA
jgi:DnaJ-class molecular chaperone